VKFYRIQPAGLGINPTAYTSAGDLLSGTWVYSGATCVFHPDADAEDYGNEVVEIESDHYYDPGDVEGVIVTDGVITRRWMLDEFARLFGFEDYDEAWRGDVDELTDDDTIPE